MTHRAPHRIVRHSLTYGYGYRRMVALGAMALFLTLSVCGAPASEPLFPFVVSYDAADNLTNLADWLDGPAGRHGFVRAEGGRFANDAGPIRFWGTNLCFEACFPSRDEAERLATRLARLGINCARLHHMDSQAIWGKSRDKLTIDPDQLERLDYLVHQLKRRGVYVNFNLHVSRSFGEAEGFPARDQRPEFDKGLDNFEPRMIELQEKYARDLLTHVNPHTGNAYTDEPAVAMVEINNENALFASWNWNQLDNLPEPYATTYRRLWNRWLRAKYGGTEQLLAAWNARRRPLGQETLEAETVPVVRHGSPGASEAARRDFVDFLWDTEAAYWRRMYRFLKETLGVKSLVSGTQLSYSPPSIQARLDYVDAHAYFEHPHFPGRSWDMKNWTIGNVALVNRRGGTLVDLAVRRVAEKPFTVSEYNHPAPNKYAAEGFPMIAAFGAFQAWDGIFSFAYSHNTDFELRRITGFFDVKSDPAKLVHMPACAAMFVRGDVAPARRLAAVDVSVKGERELLVKTLSPWNLTAAGFGLDPAIALVDRVAMR
ncbi:MAG: beta-galactosidase, partial [Pirellulales bacterium]|nr:beta-galactosidase [Pirellulales bacterium]